MANPFDPRANPMLFPMFAAGAAGAGAQQPATPPAPQGGFDLAALMQLVLGGQQQAQQAQLGAQREALGGVKLGRYGTPVNPVTGVEQGNPFDNGFFKTNEQRQGVIADRQASMPQATQLQPGWAGAFMPQPTSVDAPLDFTRILLEGITNPALDGGASAQDRTRRAMAARPQPYRMF
jgi:hypothetical protein